MHGPRDQRSGVFDRAEPRQLRALVRKTQQLDRGAFREQRDRWEIAPEQPEQIQLAMRQVVDAVTVKIEWLRAIPVIAEAPGAEAIAARVAHRFYGVQVFLECVLPKL